MTSDEMQRYLERLAQLPDNPDLPAEEEPSEEVDTPDVLVEVVSAQPGRLRRVHTNGLWWAGLPELFADPPPSYHPPEEAHWSRLAFLLASGLVALGQELAETENFDLEPYEDSFLGRPVKLWLASHEAPDEDLTEALGTVVDTVIRVQCSLWAEPNPQTPEPA